MTDDAPAPRRPPSSTPSGHSGARSTLTGQCWSVPHRTARSVLSGEPECPVGGMAGAVACAGDGRERRAGGAAAGGADRGGVHLRRRRRGPGYDGSRGAVAQRDPARPARDPGRHPVETLTRLWLLQATVPASAVERALPGPARPAVRRRAARALGRRGARAGRRTPLRRRRPRPLGGQRPDPRPRRSPNRVASDHVLGISSAATSLAQLTVREPVGRALDLGTGCGVQALHLAAHARQVVATDVNQRALRLTGSTPSSTGRRPIDVREGSFFEPVAGEHFDLVVTNPPFVISPATGERLVYRDSGLPGRPGGRAHRPWGARPARRGRDRPGAGQLGDPPRPAVGRAARRVAIDGGGCDAWVVQREVADLPTYVELWLKDEGVHGGPDYHERYDTWLSWFEEQGAEAVGFGWINLRRPTVSRRCASRTGATTSSSRSARRSPPLRPRRRPAGAQRRPLGQRGWWPARPPSGVVRRPGRRRTRRRSCSASSGWPAGPARSTPSRRPWWAPATASSSVVQILDALGQILRAGRGGAAVGLPPVVRQLLTEGYLQLPAT